MTNPPRVEPRIKVSCITPPISHLVQPHPFDCRPATPLKSPHASNRKEPLMKQFTSIEKLDAGILYCLELASSLSLLLLAFGLIASMANVLTKGAILTDNILMQRIWAITQCVGIDASVAGTIIRTFHYYQQGENVKTWLYGLLSALLLFTACIVLNIESTQQTLNIALEAAYGREFVSIELLI